jgi:UDP:flavonoid glycosyltransferase YjiC (YdhE family)
MKITIFAAGSQGDIQPCVALAKGLLQNGFQIKIAAPSDFAEFISKHGLEFSPLRGDIRQIMSSETGRKFMEKGSRNPLRSIQTIRTLIAPVITEMTEDLYTACQKSDALISLGIFSAFASSISDKLQIPLIHIEPTPLLPTGSFPTPSWPIQKDLGRIHNYLSGLLMLYVVWYWYRLFVRDLRKQLKLPVYHGSDFIRRLRSTPMLSAYSNSIIPHPGDWSENIHITGYFFLDSEEDWHPPSELIQFLNSGKKPIYIGFGSMGGQEPEKLTNIILGALEKCNQRGVLVTGWGGIKTKFTSENIIILDKAPHRWLFPQMAAVVHHGGAGTTAEVLRAGVPSVIIPFILDQPFWGARIKALGVGSNPIPHKKLTVNNLSEAITSVTTNQEMINRSKMIAELIRSENGVQNAVYLVQKILK